MVTLRTVDVEGAAAAHPAAEAKDAAAVPTVASTAAPATASGFNPVWLIVVAAFAIIVTGIGLAVGYQPSSTPQPAGQAEQVAVSHATAAQGSHPTTGLVVTWVVKACTNATTAPQGVVFYGDSPTALTHSVAATASQYTIPGCTNSSAEQCQYYPSGQVHPNGTYTSSCIYEAVVKGLQPNQAVHYSVGDAVTGRSAAFLTRTAPPVGTPNQRILIIGDQGVGGNASHTLNTALASLDEPGKAPVPLFLELGDLSYSDRRQRVWDEYSRLVQPLVSRVPVANIPGNHEWVDDWMRTFEAFRGRFRSPFVGRGVDEMYGSIDIGLVHLVMLQSYCSATKLYWQMVCYDSHPQMAWLRADLAAVNRTLTPWVVVSLHSPLYNSNSKHHGTAESARLQLEEMLYSYRVDVVLAGHVHSLERTARVYNNSHVADAPIFLNVGNGGNVQGVALPWDTAQPDWSLKRGAVFGHGELTAVNATHLHWFFHGHDAQLYNDRWDEVWVIKGEPGQWGGGTTMKQQFADGPSEPCFTCLKPGDYGWRLRRRASRQPEGGEAV